MKFQTHDWGMGSRKCNGIGHVIEDAVLFAKTTEDRLEVITNALVALAPMMPPNVQEFLAMQLGYEAVEEE